MTKFEPDKIDSLSADELREALIEREKRIQEFQDLQEKTWKQVSTILSSIPLGLAILDEEGKIEATNSQLRQSFEYETSELYGKAITCILPGLTELRASGDSIKLSGKNSSGREFKVEVSVNILETQEGSRFCVHVKDISEQQKLLEYKMNLASMISHDLRTPLTTMRAVLTSLADTTYGELNEDGKDAVGWALTSSDYMNSVLANILDTEKVDSSKMELELVETSIGKVINNSMGLMKRYADELQVKLESEYNNDVFYADEAKIVRILVNLISNAIKFSPPGETVNIEGSLEGLHAYFRVRDQGPGIAKGMQLRIFDRFQQTGKESRGRKAGFGLGLAISKEFAELHGGNITVESERDKGSTFEVSIPIAN